MYICVSMAIGSNSEVPETPEEVKNHHLSCGSLGGGGQCMFSSFLPPWHTAHNRHSVSVESDDRIQMLEVEDEEQLPLTEPFICAQQYAGLKPGVEPVLLQCQCQIINLLHHKGTPRDYYSYFSCEKTIAQRD